METLRPYPTAADRAEATRFIEAEYAHAPVYLKNNRDNLIRCAADAVMQKRMHAEYRARFTTQGEIGRRLAGRVGA